MNQYAHALVLGLGGSGEGAARLLMAEGSRVTAVDADETPDLFEKAHALELDGARVSLGVTDLPAGDFDVCIVSPGIPADSAWVSGMRRRSIPVISELELGWSRCRGRVLAVTGSNGKSTAVKWCAETAALAGCDVRIAGNYGPPISDVVRRSPAADLWVLEVSSFQLETVRAFRPDAGLLLNVLPNHLNRHGTQAEYLAIKSRIFARTGTEDRCVVPSALRNEVERLSGGRGEWVTFGVEPDADYRYEKGSVWLWGEKVADLGGTMFDNDVLGISAAGVVAALEAFHIQPACAARAARTMTALPHRMQPAGEVRGISFINDSKATNLAAMEAALRMVKGPVRLIAGGLPKETDFTRSKEVLAQRAVSVYLIGTASENMASAWSQVVPSVQCGSLEEAVRQAWHDARAGETLLLSPGCASFDQFRNFEDRGRCFLGIVKRLAEEAGI